MLRMTPPRALVLALALLACTPVTPGAAVEQPASPRLLVVLVVDQMRVDYIEQMRGRWSAGLARLVAEGAVMDRTFYPYLQTVTCAGHATIGTGTFPATHGIILNAWWRGTRSASCTDDPDVNAVPYEPGGEGIGHSAVQLLVPTLGDRLRAASPASRVVTMSIKPRSAIMLAGKSGTVTWLDDNNVWATSTAFTPQPVPAIAAFLTRQPRAAARSAVWDRSATPDHYTGADDVEGEAPPRGWTRTFPHPLAGAPGTAPQQFSTLWETSPYADAYLGDMAAALIDEMKLGQGDAVDYLGVSFSALDYVGHAFGPDSHEAQDTLLQLDQTIGRLLAVLDAKVGRDRYVLGLSADHGVAPVPEQRLHQGLVGGRINTRELVRVANAALVPALGPGQHVVRADYTQVYLSAEALARVRVDPALLEPAMAALRTVPGVDRVFPSEGLVRQRTSPDPIIRAAALSHVPGRSGHIVVVPRRFFVMGDASARGTTHGTHHDYDQHVPLIFFGAGVTPGRYADAATPADLTPTLAARIGLPMPGIDGVAHTRIFAR